MSWSYDSLRDQLGTHPGRKLGKLAAAGTAGAVAAGGLVLGTATPAGAYLPSPTNMFKIGTTTAATGSFQTGWNAVEVSLGASTYTTEGCTGGNGNFSELMTHIRNDIASHRQVVAGVPVITGHNCIGAGGETIGLTHWSTKVKNIITSAKKDTGWQRYFGGVVLDEEGGFGYSITAVSDFNRKIFDWLWTQGIDFQDTTYFFAQVYASQGTPWDNYSAYRTLTRIARQMPEVYSGTTMDTLVNGACQRSASGLVCRIMPTVYLNEPVPQLSANMKGKTITSWGSEDWYEQYTL